ncbi:MAG: phosphatidylserine decarboxylase family protein [Prevotellaceae bacterium]|jgi:phosphatidylserine decarboxylase|nr:phosphatidylserine decarboxylase family protein [Prevotellaceae bacterium]
MKTTKAKFTKRIKIRNKRIRIHKEGLTILVSFFILLFALNTMFYFLGETRFNLGFIINLAVSIAAFGFFMFFFRNPQRETEINDEGLVLAPADGRVVVIEPTEEFEYFGGQKMMQVSIFMSVLSVHANWYPVNGVVKYTKHHSGKHFVAYKPKSSTENEHSSTVVETDTGQEILVRQIAGTLARRIVTYAAVNHRSEINHHLGFIKFGSRVDLFLPLDSQIFVEINEHTKGNETIIARLPD